MANIRAMIEAQKRTEKRINEAIEMKKKTAKEKAEWSDLQAVSHFQKWIQSGKPTAENGHPKLGKIAALAITHSLLPRCSSTEKVDDYKSMKKCTEWLGGISGGTTWVEEMNSFEQQLGRSIVKTTKRLF